MEGAVRTLAPAGTRRRNHRQPGVTTTYDLIDNPVRNGVDTATLFATVDAVRANPEIAKFQFRASNSWVSGTHNRSTIHGFYGAMQEMEHAQAHTYDADHPAVLVGHDHGPAPVEFVLHALAACLTAGLASIAGARKVNLSRVTSTVEGDIDLLGILELGDGSVRNGFQGIKVRFELDGDDAEAMRKLVEQSRARSAVYDMVTASGARSITVKNVFRSNAVAAMCSADNGQ